MRDGRQPEDARLNEKDDDQGGRSYTSGDREGRRPRVNRLGSVGVVRSEAIAAAQIPGAGQRVGLTEGVRLLQGIRLSRRIHMVREVCVPRGIRLFRGIRIRARIGFRHGILLPGGIRTLKRVSLHLGFRVMVTRRDGRYDKAAFLTEPVALLKRGAAVWALMWEKGNGLIGNGAEGLARDRAPFRRLGDVLARDVFDVFAVLGHLHPPASSRSYTVQSRYDSRSCRPA